jgi:hypothetical protein
MDTLDPIHALVLDFSSGIGVMKRDCLDRDHPPN